MTDEDDRKMLMALDTVRCHTLFVTGDSIERCPKVQGHAGDCRPSQQGLMEFAREHYPEIADYLILRHQQRVEEQQRELERRMPVRDRPPGWLARWRAQNAEPHPCEGRGSGQGEGDSESARPGE